MRGAGQSVDGNVLEIRRRAVAARRAADPDVAALPAAGAVHRERRPRQSTPKPRRRSPASTDPRATAERLTRRVNAHARQEADRQPAVGARGAAHQGRRLQRAHGALCRDGARRWAFRRASPSASPIRAARSTTTRGPRSTSTKGAAAACGCRSIPTFNQFPADATHVRLTRGGLDKQAAILPLIGHLKMNIIDLELAPNSTPDPASAAARWTPAPLSAAVPRPRPA